MSKNIKNTISGALLCTLIMAMMAATTLLLSSCTYTDMDISKIGAEPKIVLYCFPTPESDTTCITVMRSVPVTEREPGSTYGATAEELRLPDAKVTFLLNGVAQEVKYTAEKTASLAAGSFYVTCHIAEGDKIEVSATAAGLPSVSAETTVPGCHVVKGIRSTTVTHDYTDYRQLLVGIDGAAMRGGYYAVTVSLAYTLTGWNDGTDTVTTAHEYRTNANLTDEPLVSPSEIDIDLFDTEKSFYDSFYIFNGSNITSDSYTLRLNVDYINSIYAYGYSGWRVKDPRYVIRLYRIDPAMYKFLNSINNMADNHLAEYGLAPVLPTCTNVSGGLGVVGGCGVDKAELPIKLEYYGFDIKTDEWFTE